MKKLSERTLYKMCLPMAREYHLSPLLVILDYYIKSRIYGLTREDYFQNACGVAMSNIQWRQFFSFRKYLRLRESLNDAKYKHILDNKVETLKYFASFVKHSWLYPKEASFDEFQSFLAQHPKVFIKPLWEYGGKRVEIYDSTQNTIQSFNMLVEQDMLLEECVDNDNRLVFNNNSLNTIRVYTVLDKEHNPYVLKAVLRVGVGDAVIDNFHMGGVIYPINVAGGFVESYGNRRAVADKVYIHPGTNVLMMGYKIPLWEELIISVKIWLSLFLK